MTTTTFIPASDKQVAFIHRLIAEREVSAGAEDRFAAQVEAGLSKAQATANIDVLIDLPKKAVVNTDGAAVSEGYFWVEGLVYKVQKSQANRLYAKVFTDSGYAYAPGAINLLGSATRLTLEQAAEMGVKTGRCVICGKTLTDPASVEAGIGPVCALRF